ncbi:xylulokinase [Streptomyces fulvoviolaceus]|uniref:xylulokinase n=1 Tax=Streptomyces fulvoviolaceus TaxID=285535 RepID=UPI0006944C1D|nr:xylulokinase [Streptomyces fulvoviolaceus]MCT9080875.1 xylulokinase [Streptomyces fulvoviolaceus]
MPVVAGVDSSTQSCKVEIRDLHDGSLLGSGSAPHPPAFPPRSEQDPAAWWAALKAALAAARKDAGVSRGDIAALAVDGQCHGLVALDAADQVIRPAKLWNDTTSAPQLERLKRLIGAPEWIRAVGSLPTAAFTLSKIAWLAENEPDHYRRLSHVLLPHDWLTWKLSGRHVTDRSEASGTGYYSAAESRYLPEFLAHVDAQRDWADALPEVVDASTPAGTVSAAASAELDLSPGTLVGPGGGDQHAAAVGLGIVPGDVVYTFGTSGVVFTTKDTPVFDLSGMVDCVADMTDGYLPLVSTLNAARVTDTFARILGVDHDTLAELALRAGDSGPVLAAFLDGERKPNRPGARGVLAGLTSATGPEDIARAAFEGVILGLVSGEQHLNAAGVATGGRLIATGGGARSAAYTQLLADLTGREVLVADAPEASARGACVQAAAIASDRPVREVLRAWAPATRSAATPRPGSGTARRAAADRYAVLAGWDALDTSATDDMDATDATGSSGTTA